MSQVVLCVVKNTMAPGGHAVECRHNGRIVGYVRNQLKNKKGEVVQEVLSDTIDILLNYRVCSSTVLPTSSPYNVFHRKVAIKYVKQHTAA
mmetsp:Transcript_19597/g.27599  ORF Transcript_19597/g.27599 Transcript_19597/m.27599 type:complete len:91 (-) Transcript_19597:120-392(-)